jgi:hypothetical protein
VQDLVHEENYAATLLFLKASAYRRRKPFADLFGVTSRKILNEAPTLEERAALPVAELA